TGFSDEGDRTVLKAEGAGVQRRTTALAEHESHHRAKHVHTYIIVRETGSRLAPQAGGATIHQKTSTVSIGQLEKSAVSEFRNGKRIIFRRIWRGSNTNRGDRKRLSLNCPAWNFRKIELNVRSQGGVWQRIQTADGEVRQ